MTAALSQQDSLEEPAQEFREEDLCFVMHCSDVDVTATLHESLLPAGPGGGGGDANGRQLPHDVISISLRKAALQDARTLALCACTCKAFNKLIVENDLWKVAFFGRPDPAPCFDVLDRSLSCLTGGYRVLLGPLHVRWCFMTDTVLKEMDTVVVSEKYYGDTRVVLVEKYEGPPIYFRFLSWTDTSTGYQFVLSRPASAEMPRFARREAMHALLERSKIWELKEEHLVDGWYFWAADPGGPRR